MEAPEVKAGHSFENNIVSESDPIGLTNRLGDFHVWYVCSHGRPTHCNYCRGKLSGMAWHGLSLCRMKAHKRCAAKIVECCKWKTEASIPSELRIIGSNGSYCMPHQWIEGNLPLGCKCFICDKTCGSVLKLQDWRCIWCGIYAHDQCKVNTPSVCSLNQIRLSILPPVAVGCINESGEADIHWECVGGELGGGSPLLVLVNSKSGENQGMRILAKFKRLLNPTQVIDIIAEGPDKGKFDLFRVLVCGGDGTVGWVLTAVDSLELLSKCQIGILPLGTGNDLARVLGWGRAFDDESQLIHVIEKFERAHTRMLDRWSIITSTELTSYAMLKRAVSFDIERQESYINMLLDGINHASDESSVLCAVRILNETLREFISLTRQALVGNDVRSEDVGNNDVQSQDEILLARLENLLRMLETLPITSDESELYTSDEVSIEQELSLPLKFKSQRELLLKRENSLRKTLRQLTEHAKIFSLNTKRENRSALTRREHFRKKRSRTAPGDNTKTDLKGRNEGGGSLMSLHAHMPFTAFPGIADFSFGDIYSLCASPLNTVSSVLVPSFSVSPPASDFRKISNNSVPAQLKIPCIGDVEPPTPERTTSGFEISHFLPLKWTVTKGSVDESNDFLLPDSVGNIVRSLSDSIKSKNVGDLSHSFSDLQIIPPIDFNDDPFPTENANVCKIYEKMKSKSDSSICQWKNSISSGAAGNQKSSFIEKKVMNNYFGIGLDAKIALEFHNKREELPEKTRSRSKLFMWYGMLGGKELLQRTFRNLDQRIRLECDGQVMRLPSLQGVVILNIPSYSGGANFWGSRKESRECSFAAQSFDDRMLEVVALFGVIHVATSRVSRLPLQKHRIAQASSISFYFCRHVNIVVTGDEPIPVQVDGEPWLQPPGVIEIVHKNRAQMLVHDPVFEATLRTWQEQNKVIPSTPIAVVHPHFPAIDVPSLFVEAAATLVDLLDPEHNDVHPYFLQQSFGQLVIKASCAITSALASDCVGVNINAAVFDIILVLFRLIIEDELVAINEVLQSVRILLDEISPKLVVVVCSDQSYHDDGGMIKKQEWFNKLDEAIVSVRKEMENLNKYLLERGIHLESSKEISTVFSVQAQKNDDTRMRSRVRFRVAQWFRNKWIRRRKRAASADAAVLSTWNVEDVQRWMNSAGFKEYSDSFRTNNVDGKRLLRLATVDLRKLGFCDVTSLLQFQGAVNDLKRYLGTDNKNFMPPTQGERSSYISKSKNNEASISSF